MEETKKTDVRKKAPVYVERADKTIVRTKHPRLEIRVLDADCTPRQLEHALRMAYEWVKYRNRVPEASQTKDPEAFRLKEEIIVSKPI